MTVKDRESNRICRALWAIDRLLTLRRRATGGFGQRNGSITFKEITGCCVENILEGIGGKNGPGRWLLQ